MQAIRPIISMKRIASPIQIVDPCVLDSIRGSSNRLSEIGCVVCFVEFGVWKAEDDVVACDFEFLDGGAVGEEGKC